MSTRFFGASKNAFSALPQVFLTMRSGIRRFTRAVAAAVVLPAMALATDTWEPTGWANNPEFKQFAIVERVVQAPNGQFYVSFYNQGIVDGVRDGAQLGQLMRLNADGSIDESFNVGPGWTRFWGIAVQADGKIVAGGISSAETSQTGSSIYRVFRFNPDGSLDNTFNSPVFEDIPRFISLFADNSMIVVPSSGSSGNGGIATMAYLEADGSINPSFTEPDLAGGFIFAPVVLAPSGHIFVAGSFDSVNGTARPGVAKLNSDGSLDTTFAPSGFNPDFSPQQVRGIGLQSMGANAGKLIVAGGTIVVPGSDDAGANRPLIRLHTDGSLDTSFNLTTQGDAGMAPRPRLMKVLSDDSITIVGSSVRRFDAEGNQFDSSTYARSEFSTESFWMEALDDGSVIVPPQAGASINGSPVNTLTKFASDGSIDTGFNAPEFVGNIYPGNFHSYDDGRFLVWGNFDTANGESRPGIARFWSDGILEAEFAPDFIAPPAYVTEASVAGDGRILVSTRNPATGSSTIARLNSDGSVDNTFVLDGSLGDLGGLRARQLGDGKVILTGLNLQRVIDDTVTFTLLDDSGTIDPSFDASGIATPAEVFRESDDSIRAVTLGAFSILAEDDQGRLIVSSTTGAIGENPTTMDASLLRINRDGSIDQTFNGPTVSWPTLGVSFPFFFNGSFFEQIPTTGTGSPFRGVEILDDGSMYVFGFFRDLNGAPVAGVARLFSDGSVDTSFDVGTGPAFTGAPNRFGQVTGLYPMENGRIFVTGYFYEFNGEPASGLLQLESDGSRVGGFHTSPDLEPYTGGDIGVQKSQWSDHILVAGTFRPDWWRPYPDAFMRLRQIPLVEIYAQPQGLSLMPGQGGVLRVGYTDPQADITIQWFKDGQAIDGATSEELFVSGEEASLGNYQAEITGGGETVWTDEVGVEFANNTESWLNVDSFSPPDFVTDRFVGRVVPDGNGGYFASFVNGSRVTGADGQTLGAVVRLNGDGSVDSSFNIGNVLSNAWAIMPLSDGSVLVGGEPSTENGGSGFSNYYVFKFSASGGIDYSFASLRLGGIPRFMSMQPDGKILVVPNGNNGANGGWRWITRLNADGSWDDTFHQVWLDNPIFAPPVFDASGKIYIGGFFNEVDGVFRPNVARLNADGTRDDSWYPTGMDSNNPPAQVRGLAIQGEGGNAGKLLVAGGALNVPDGQGGSINSPVIRLNPDGSRDEGFTYVTQGDAGMNPRPRLLHKFDDDSFIAVGATVTKFLADGAIDTGYNMPDIDREAFWFAVNDDGSVVVPVEPGANLNGSPSANLVKLLPNGLPDSGFVSPQFELFTFPGRFIPDGASTYVVGGFDRIGGIGAPGIAKLNYDGSVDSGFSVPSVTFPETVAFADLDANGRIVAALRDQNTGKRSGIIRLNSDGSLDGGFNLDSSLMMSGIEILTRSDNSVLIWSDHPQYLIDDSAGWGLLQDNGTIDDTFGPADDPVLGQVYRFGDGSIDSITQGDFRVLDVADDGSFIARRTIGGYPQWAGSLEHTIKRYHPDGTEDASFNAPTVWWGTGLNFPMVTDAQTNGGNPFQPAVTQAFSPFSGAILQDDGKVIVYGGFNDLWGYYRPGIARLNTDGSVDESFNPGGGPEFLQAPWREGRISNVSLAEGGRLWVTGFFDAFSGFARSGIALLEPSGQIVPGFGTDLEFRPWITSDLTAESTEDGTLLVGGSFEANGGGIQAFHRLAVDAVEESGQLYWRNPLPRGGDLTAIIHDGARFVAVGTGSQVVHSADGVTWSDPVFFPEEVMNGITYDGSTYVAVGGGGTIYTSADLSTWTLAARDQDFRWLFDVEHSGGLFVAVGDGGNVMVSNDGGANWTSYSAGVDQTLQEVAFGVGKFVTVSWNGVVLHSSGGQSWTQATLPSGFESTGYHSVDFVNGEFVVFGDSGAMLTSSDGMTWAGSTVQNGEWLFGVVFDGAHYLAITGDDRILQSTDLATWSDRSTGNGLPIGSIRGIAENGGTTVVVGAGNLIRSSTDSGSSWTDRGSVGSTSAIHDIAWFDDGFHAVGSSATYLTSPDGTFWTVNDTGSGHWFNAIARGAGVDVIATGFGYMLVDNGSGWQEIDVGDNQDNRDLIYADGAFHAVGSGGTYRVSSDGSNWSSFQIAGYENQNLQSVAIDNGVRVIVGDNGLILRSDDGGSSWTDHSTGSWQGLTKVRFLDGLFVAVGQDRTVLLSEDGMTWDQAPVPNDYVNFGWGYADVGRGPDAYYVVSTQGRVLRTTDWTNWTQFGALETKPDLVALAASPNRLVVGGSGGAILSTGGFENDGSLSLPGGGLAEFTPFAGRGSATLSVFATGPGDLTYTWDKDGQVLPGQNLPLLILSDLTPGDAGLYTVTVTSSAGPTLTSSTELVPAGFPDGDGPIYGVGDLPGGAAGSQIRAATLVNGVIHAAGGSGGQPGGQTFDTGILWRSDEGLTVLPNIVPFSTGISFVMASAITPDARFIASRGRSASDNNSRQATRIDTNDFSVDALPFSDGLDFYSAATAISDEGSVLYAFAINPATNGYETVRHEPDSGTTTLLEIPQGNFDQMFPGAGLATTSDGSIMVGSVANTADPTVNQAYIYEHGVGVSLVPLPTGGTWSAGQGITADGGTVLITGDTTAFPNGEVYLLNTSDDSIEPLGSPMADRRPNNFIGMSSDASVVVAIFQNDESGESDTFIRNQHGWFPLEEVVISLGASLDGWELSGGLGVSGDGRLVFGAGERNGILEGFVVEFPEGYLANYSPAEAVVFGIGSFPGSGSLGSELRDATLVDGNIHATGFAQDLPNPSIPPRVTSVYWSLADGLQRLPHFSEESTFSTPILANSITPDGTYIVGRTWTSSGNFRQSARWDTRDLSVELVTTPPDVASFGYSAATTISDDGNRVASFYVPGSGVFGAFITDIDTDAVTTLVPDVPNVTRLFPAGPHGFSSDGSVLVGNYQIIGETTDEYGYRYTDGGGFTTLPLLAGGSWNRATAVTSDGQITLLAGDSTAFPGGELYLHDASDGSLTPLGSPESDATTDSFLMGMTGTADVMVARFTRPDDSFVSYVRNDYGWFGLNEAVQAAGGSLGNWDLTNVTGISRDGRLVFGSGLNDGVTEGFVVQFEENFLASYVPRVFAGPVDPEIVGAWKLDEGDSTAILVFTADGHYAHMQDVNSASPDEQTGYELGRYEFNLDGSFFVQTSDDTNGESGLSSDNGRDDLMVSITNDQLTYTVPGDGAFTLTRVEDDTDPIVGGWIMDSDTGGNSEELVIVVLDEAGNYYLLHDGPAEANAQPGLEWGSYTWDSSTNAFVVSNIVIDQNGEFGLNDPVGAAMVEIQDLGYRLFYSDQEDGAPFSRITILPVDIATQPEGDELDAGEDLNLSIAVNGDGPFSYQWRKDGVNIDGATDSSYMIMGVNADDAGNYDVIVTGPDGSVVSASAVVIIVDQEPSNAFLANLSVQQVVETGGVFALPFRIEGEASKMVLLRAVGPTFGSFGVPDTMDDPRMRLVDDLGFEVAANDDWEDPDGSSVSSSSSSVGAFPLGAGNADAAMLLLLPAGSYTLLIDSAGEGGLVLAEIYDADSSIGTRPVSRLVYLAALGDRSLGIFNPGFVMSGGASELVVRALGSGTGLPGASSNPLLSVSNSGGQIVAQNDDWGSVGDLELDFEDVGAPPLIPGSSDAAEIFEAAEGAYTMQVNGSSGHILAEIYDLYDRDLPTTPILLVPARSMTVTEGDMARFETVVGGAGPISFQWLKDGSPVSEGNAPILDFMSVTQGDAGDYVLQLTNGTGTYDSAPVTLTVETAATPPSISSQPTDTTVQSGETATLNVTVVSTAGGLSYQWYEGTSGDTSLPVAGATLPSFTTSALSTTTSYWVRATDDAGGVDSNTATVTVAAPSEIFATHSVVGSGYVAGGSVTVTTTLTYTGSADSFGWNVSLPAGWSYQAIAMPPVPQVTPTSGNTGVIGFAFTSPPASPVTFTYVLNVPAEQTGVVNLTAEVLFRDGQAETPDEQVFVVTPDPLVIGPVPPFHSADTNGDSAIDLSELLRVIQLYNTRNGTARTGHYKVQAGTEDGFAPDPTLTNSDSGGLSRFHSADTGGEGDNPDGKIDLSELLRVIQIYNYRSGTTRTGEYRIQAGTEDGFAPGPEPVF
jgi:uncharacterized delta-60 repeat protein